MTPRQANVVLAQAQAKAARERLAGTTAAVQARLQPAVLMREARHGLMEALLHSEVKKIPTGKVDGGSHL